MADDKETKVAWFDRRMKAKMTTLGIFLITIAFYVVMFLGKDESFFLHYALVVSLLVGALSAADVINTMMASKGSVPSGGDQAPSKNG